MNPGIIIVVVWLVIGTVFTIHNFRSAYPATDPVTSTNTTQNAEGTTP